MTDTDFSLLLPVYQGDRADHLRDAFRTSVIDQTLPPTEVVLVQDGPVGEELAATLDELAADSPVPVRIVRLEANGGLAVALDIGLEHCTYDVVARMDADDISYPTRFAKQLAALDRGLDLVGTGLVEFEGSLDRADAVRIPPVGDRIPAAARFFQPFNHPTVVYRRSVVQSAGGYEPMGLMEDYWLFARMIHAGAKVDNIPTPLLGYRIDAGAYKRRGGWRQFRNEMSLQRALRRIGFTTRSQYARNLLIRGVYRLIPEGLRKLLYRARFTR